MKNVALITGASSGIGKELAIIHAKNQGDLVLVARRKELLDSLASELIEKYSISVLVKEMDLTKSGAVKKLVTELTDENI
ncbi:MAG: SDR family NAD(P)-dependent oxidoreductase, partial [Bacteroidota bacterium]